MPTAGLNAVIINAISPDVPMGETFREHRRITLPVALPAITLFQPRLMQ